MDLSRNEISVLSIIAISIIPVNTENSSLKEFEEIYSTPSKISHSINSSLKDGGLEYTNRIELLYPGLEDENFANFHDLLHQRFEVKIEFNNNKVYLFGGNKFGMEMKIIFNPKKGTKITLRDKTTINPKYLGSNIEQNTRAFAFRITHKL